MCCKELQWALSAVEKVVPVVRAEDESRIGAFIAEGKTHSFEIGDLNFVHTDRGSQRMLKAPLEDVLDQAAFIPLVKLLATSSIIVGNESQD